MVRLFMGREQKNFNSMQLFIGMGALFLGALEYILSRPADTSYMGRLIGGYSEGLAFRFHIYGDLGGVLPDFIHPFSFALLTLALMPNAPRSVRAMICLFWLLVDLMFEIGQCLGLQLGQFFTKLFPDCRALELFTDYFITGTFDYLDIMAICLGAMAAFIICEKTKKGGLENDSNPREKREERWVKTTSQNPIFETCR